MHISHFPDFAPLTLETKDEMRRLLENLPDGVSEFSFANLFLFRARYGYRVSLAPRQNDAHHTDGEKTLVISGALDGKSFFETPTGVPSKEALMSLFQTHDYWKCVPPSIAENGGTESLAEWGVELVEDRDNFDYLYLRTDLAELSGKKFHKKRNLVNTFLNMYIPQVQEMSFDTIPAALKVLERWKQDKGEDGDYTACKEALEQFDTLGMSGNMYYINGYPAGWCLGESLARGSMFAVHFEKGIDDYKGIYQYINQNFAASLGEQYMYINREQDLGDEGLRQAKMTYRPAAFVKKYRGTLHSA